MAITQNSAYNIDEDMRKSSYVWHINSPLNTDYICELVLQYPITVTSVIAECTSGSFNLTMKKIHSSSASSMNPTNQVISSSRATFTPTTNNVLVLGDTIYFTISNVTNAILAKIQINYIRDFIQ